LQGYEEKKSLADYLSAISSTGTHEVQFTDRKIKNLFNRVQFSFNSNILLGLYSEGLATFNQFIFPFAANLASDLSLTKLNTIQTKAEIVAQTIQRINLIEAKLQLYKLAVHNIDEHILKGEFSSSVYSSVPFYTWTSDQFQHTIHNLLSGEPVTLMAHPEQSAPGRVCVKFTEVKLFLKWTGNGEGPQLMKELEHFQIKMTHHGRSYYMAAKSEVYVIEGYPINFVYTNTSSSLSQLKVSYGESIMSPYGMWIFQIKTIPQKLRSYDYLKSFSGNVDLHLEGAWTYLNEDSLDFESLKLNQYYKKVDQGLYGTNHLKEKIGLYF